VYQSGAVIFASASVFEVANEWRIEPDGNASFGERLASLLERELEVCLVLLGGEHVIRERSKSSASREQFRVVVK
jgi:hypothetical protein